MNSSKLFEDVINYLEGVIVNDSEINYNEISKIAMRPATLFQRIFMFVSGISISDYVRKRRLSLAGKDLRNSDIAVLDVAIKYGFKSHSAFTRAFKEFHGVNPSEAKMANLNEYPPINFSDMRFVGGKRIMAEMKKIIYKESKERLMVGMYRETSFFDSGKVWKEYFEGDTDEKIATLSEVTCCDDIDANEGIGFMYNFSDMNNFNFIIGNLVKIDAKIPAGLYTKHVPKGLTARVQFEGVNVAEILDSAYFLITEAIEKTGKEIDHDNFYWCEVYTVERYCECLRRDEKVTIDYILPVKDTDK